MRILTVRQPWAWAIIHAGKDVENRVRNVAGAYRGPVAIHAGLTDDIAADYFDPANDAMQAWQDAYGPVELGARPWDPRGVIIGLVDLVDVHENDAAACYDCSEWAEGAWHMVLSNARPLAEPIPYKGALGMRTLPDDVERQILVAVSS